MEKGSLVEALAAVRGFFLKFDSDQPPETVRQWPVRVLDLQRNGRHGDRAVQEAFWTELDRFLAASRSKLAY